MSGAIPKARTGVPGLDDILLGGLAVGRIFLLEGSPGTGKTTMALSFLLQGAAAGELWAVDRAYMREASFTHLTRLTTEARTNGTSSCIANHIQKRRDYKPPSGGRLRQELQHECKAFAGRYYQFLSGHSAAGAFLCSRLNKIPSDRCWWCGQGERQPPPLRPDGRGPARRD